MSIGEIIAIGRLAGETIKLALAQLPTHEQRKLDGFFKLLDKYNEEIIRADMDHDDLLVYKQRIDTLTNTVISELQKGRSK